MATILVVDDESSLRHMLTLLLRTAGHTVSAAGDARDAWRLITQNQPDLLICDHMMPGTQGASFCGMVRRTPALAGLPIIMCSALEPRLIPDSHLCDVVLQKPVPHDTLLAVIDHLLRHTRVMERAHGA